MSSRNLSSINFIKPTITLVVLLLAGMTTAPVNAVVPELINQGVPTLAPLVDKTAPAVVSIAIQGTVKTPRNPLMDDPFFRRFFGAPPGAEGGERKVRSAGSGVIVDSKKGLILTNHHVVENADEILVTLTDGRTFDAKIIGSDAGTDIAVIELEEPKSLVEMNFADSDKAKVGDFVLAIGNPFGLQHTVTSGIISQLGRTGINRDGYEDFIQTDAAINPGNSGGALVDMNGELIGINSAIFSQSGGNIGIGFAIPSNMAKAIMEQLVEFGEVRRGLLGVSITDFTKETAEAYGMKNTDGALVQEIVPGSAAEEAGIEVGDVIIEVDSKKVTGASELRNYVGLKRSGDKVKVTVLREGKEKSFTATLSSVESINIAAADEIHPGLEGAEFATYTGAPGSFVTDAVLVNAVEQNSPAAMNGLRPNDLITSVNRVRISSIQELTAAAEDQPVLLLRVVRGTRTLLLQIR
jgi:serine protease Do/serine protease DegQ